MKKLLSHLIMTASLFALIICGNNATAQNTFMITAENVTQTAPNVLEWDIYLLNTDVPAFELGSMQLGFTFNSGIYAGGTVAVTKNNTTSGLLSTQQFTANPNTATAGVIKLAGVSPPGAGNGTIISTVSPGTLVTHFTLTSSVNFPANSQANLAFCSSTATNPLYPTRVSQYVSSINTPLVVTSGVNAIVNGNPVLNPTPSTQTTSIAFSCVTSSMMGVSWTNGDGTSRAVFAKAGSGPIVNPSDFTTYTASSDWSVPGTQLSTSGYFCIYDGTGSSMTLTNLAPGTLYTFQAFEYNGGAGGEVYLTSTASNNPNTQSTYTGNTWLGTTSTDWSVGTNWSDGVPDGLDNIYISAATSNQPHVTALPSTPAVCNAINICSGATLTIDPGKALTAFGATDIQGSFVISSDPTGTGSFIDNGTVLGNITVNQFLLPGRWWYIGSPVSFIPGAVAFGPLSPVPSTGTRALYWDEPTHVYVPVTDAYPLTPMQGYSFQDFAGPHMATFIGNLNTGPLGNPANLTRTTGYKEGFNLMSNPYTSAVNFDVAHVGIVPNNLETTIWYKSFAVFATFNYSNGLNANGGTPFIPAMQAFWLRVAGGVSGGLMLDNTARLHAPLPFYKIVNESDVFRMETSDGTTNDEMVVGFIDNALGNFEDNDSRKMLITDADFPQVYTLTSDAVESAINGQPELLPSETRIVPVGFSTSVAGTFTFNATNLSDFNSDISVQLEDVQTSIMQDLRQTPTYSFTSGIVNDANRFKLHFGNTAAGIVTSSTDEMTAYAYNNTIYVNIPTSGTGLIELIDMVGNKILAKQSVQGLNIVMANVAQGIYLVKVHTDSGVITKKVIINK